MPRILIPLADSPVLLAAIGTVAAVTAASLLWLHQSSELATTGQRIFELDHQRQALVEQRALALGAYAAATDPRRVEARARALGFGPAREVSQLVLPPGSPVAASIPADSPLAITNGVAIRVFEPQPSLTERILAVGLSSASAAEKEPRLGIGSGR